MLSYVACAAPVAAPRRLGLCPGSTRAAPTCRRWPTTAVSGSGLHPGPYLPDHALLTGAVRYGPAKNVPDTGGSMAADDDRVIGSGGEPPPFDTSVAHVARVYNYWLGGKDNFAADRAAGEQAIKAFPGIPLSARSNRAFLARTVRFLAGEAGVRQFLDVGTGIPSANNTHEVAQAVAPASRVVYVDNDPIVLTHARALLA